AVDVVDAERDMPVAVSDLVARRVPVVGELDLGVLRVLAVAQEGEGELAFGKVFARDELHPEHVAVERDRALEITHAQHGVEDAHAAHLTSSRYGGASYILALQ